MNWFTISLILFLIMDPFGNVSSYLSLVKGLPPAKQRKIVTREMFFALGAMLVFNFLGEYLFDLLQVSEQTLRIASGIILFLVAVKILFATPDNPRNNLPKGEPYLIPLAIPLIAGPVLLATIMLFAHIVPSIMTMVLAIITAWLASMVVLFFAPQLQKTLGTNGLVAVERLMGMVLILLAIQRFLEGIQQFVTSCHIT